MTSFPFNPSIFREYDIRGIAEKDLTTAFAKALGFAYAEFIKKRFSIAAGTTPEKKLRIAIGRDCRLTGEAYATALIESITASGIDVVNLGVCPTPLTYFSVFHLSLDGGIMVTGSHNPADYNGFKICVGKDTLHGSDIQELRKIMERGAEKPQTVSVNPGVVSATDIIPLYQHYIRKITQKGLRPLKVVLDAGNGTAGSVAPSLFRSLGVSVVELYCELDGRFPNHHPDPTVPANLKDLVRTVLEQKADFGVAFDGDSDRIGLVNEKGEILFGDELMVLLSREVLRTNPGATIISEVKSSYRLYDDIKANGGQGIMWKTGHSLIKAKMKETKAALAGEMSGHIFFADRYFGYDDAIYAAVRVLEIVAQNKNKPLSALLSDLPKTVSTPEIRVDCVEEKKFALVAETRSLLSSKHERINDIDGVRVDFENGWGLVRASNTQPVLVLRFEATTLEEMNSYRSDVEQALNQAAKNIGHPPINTHQEAGH